MRETEPDCALRGRDGVHAGGRVTQRVPPGQYRRHQDGIADRLRLRGEMQMHVRRHAGALQPVPQAVRRVRVVVARDQVPFDRRELPHALDRLPQRAVAGVRHVIDVAGHQHRRRTLRLGEPAKPADHL